MPTPWSTERIKLLVESLAPDSTDVDVQFRTDVEGPYLYVSLASRLTTINRLSTVLERAFHNTRIEVRITQAIARL